MMKLEGKEKELPEFVKKSEKSKEGKMEKIEEVKETTEEEEKEHTEEKHEGKDLLVGSKSNATDYMSMMCPICLFFMYKSVCTSCGHMFWQFCLDEYLIFKDSCPVWEKSIRRGKITRWCVADSAIEKMINFTSEECRKEWDEKKQMEDKFYIDKAIDPKIINQFSSSAEGEAK